MVDKAPDPDVAIQAVGTRRAQTAIDSGAALLLTMLVWPFPLARATLPPLVNVIGILLLWQLIQVAYFAIAMMVWGATAGTHLTGIRVVAVGGSTATRRQRGVWGALSGLVAVPRVIIPVRIGKRDMPERAAGVEVLSAASTD